MSSACPACGQSHEPSTHRCSTRTEPSGRQCGLRDGHDGPCKFPPALGGLVTVLPLQDETAAEDRPFQKGDVVAATGVIHQACADGKHWVNWHGSASESWMDERSLQHARKDTA